MCRFVSVEESSPGFELTALRTGEKEMIGERHDGCPVLPSRPHLKKAGGLPVSSPRRLVANLSYAQELSKGFQ